MLENFIQLTLLQLPIVPAATGSLPQAGGCLITIHESHQKFTN
jgi:hypothetical protein